MFGSRKCFIVGLASLCLVTLCGCSSNRETDGTTSSGDGTLETAQTLGVDNCLTCHDTGVGAVWLAGVHGNPDLEPFSNLVTAECLVCHDQLGDGQLLFAATNGAEADRPVIGCESCHGGGQYHRGIGPLPYVSPDQNRCGQCHNASFPHTSSPEGKGIAEAYAASPHARSLNDHVFVDGSTKDVQGRCSKCHSDEGSKLYRTVDGDYTALSSLLPNSTPNLKDASPIQCRTCHKPHSEQELLEAASAGRSTEFNTCTNCHQLLTNTNQKIAAYHDPAVNAYGDDAEIITDTHFATAGTFPGTQGSNTSDITGYAMDFNDARVCRNCHNPHNADTTINRQWAASGHADMAAAAPWAHYNWTDAVGGVRNDGSVIGSTGSKAACQRCHTTSGVNAYLAANADGDASDYVAPLAYNPNFKPEMLQCRGCHSDSIGTVRATGRITADYTGAPHQYPDALASNLCLACHTGRESGETIKNSGADFTGTSFVNSHYLAAGGTVFTATGYEYDADDDPLTDDYANPAYYAHDQIGMGTDDRLASWEAGNGTNGPCIGCHLSSAESHTYLPVTKDEAGEITAVTATVCANCHSGDYALTPAALIEEEEGFAAALEALAAELTIAGHPYSSNYPYFAAGDWTNGGDYDDGKDVMGAAFNYNLLANDPGAYAHNRYYAKRLIFDSIDLLDNNQMDGTIDLSGYPAAAAYLGEQRP